MPAQQPRDQLEASRMQMMHFQQEMHGVDCAVVDEEEVELLSVTLAATRLVEESQVRGCSRRLTSLWCTSCM